MTALKIHAYDVPQTGAPESYQSAVDPNAYVPDSNGLLVKMSVSLLSSTISATTALDIAGAMPGKVQAQAGNDAAVAMALAGAAVAALAEGAPDQNFSYVIVRSKVTKTGWDTSEDRMFVHFIHGASNTLAWYIDPENSSQFLPLAFYVEG
ncbi:MAG: hypothetical protein AAFP86_17785 [Planctomycetota bacterium]